MKPSEPLVSVVVPAYNAARTIETTLRSVLAQTMGDLEVIVVNDGSTDATAEVAESLGDPRIRVLSQPNVGHAAARNTGIEAANGRYVAIIDADDVWLPQKLECQLAALVARPQIRALHGSAVIVDDSLRPLFVAPGPAGKHDLLDVLCFRGLAALMDTLIIERALLQEIGGFDPSLIILQDWELAIRLARVGALYSISTPLALYRLHPGNQSKQVELHIEPGERILARVFSDPTLPREIAARRSYVYAHFYAMLSGGSLQVGRRAEAYWWARRALASDPRVFTYVASLPARRVRKRLSRRRAESIVGQRLSST